MCKVNEMKAFKAEFNEQVDAWSFGYVKVVFDGCSSLFCTDCATDKMNADHDDDESELEEFENEKLAEWSVTGNPESIHWCDMCGEKLESDYMCNEKDCWNTQCTGEHCEHEHFLSRAIDGDWNNGHDWTPYDGEHVVEIEHHGNKGFDLYYFDDTDGQRHLHDDSLDYNAALRLMDEIEEYGVVSVYREHIVNMSRTVDGVEYLVDVGDDDHDMAGPYEIGYRKQKCEHLRSSVCDCPPDNWQVVAGGLTGEEARQTLDVLESCGSLAAYHDTMVQWAARDIVKTMSKLDENGYISSNAFDAASAAIAESQNALAVWQALVPALEAEVERSKGAKALYELFTLSNDTLNMFIPRPD